MKIAVWHNLPSGGGKRALYYHVRGLVARGHQLSAWTLDTADQSYLPLSEFIPERVVRVESKSHTRGVIDRLSPNYNQVIDEMRAFDEACKVCAREIDAGDFDLLFANSSVAYAVPYVLRHVRLQKVLYLQEPDRIMYEARPGLPWVDGAPEDLEQVSLFQPRKLVASHPKLQTLRVKAKQEWLSARACDLMLVNSYFSRESMLRIYGVDARVCYLGVDTALFRDLRLPRESFVVGVGSFNPIKGIDLAVRALGSLPAPRPALVWIANATCDQYQQQIGELARSVGVELKVLTAIRDDELVTTLNKATLLLYTSRLEPFGLAPLEANACGLPVVGIAEGGIRETIKDGVNGFLVDPEPEKIAHAAERLLRNPDLARQMGQQAIGHVQQNWNVEDSVDRLEQILRSEFKL
jgi:glycosyltransferase involved in cell wall biosynthesis